MVVVSCLGWRSELLGKAHEDGVAVAGVRREAEEVVVVVVTDEVEVDAEVESLDEFILPLAGGHVVGLGAGRHSDRGVRGHLSLSLTVSDKLEDGDVGGGLCGESSVHGRGLL